MANTALRAGDKKESRTIIFKSRQHEQFYYEYLQKCRYQDVYHKALVYCLGIDRDTREHVDRIYDFKTGFVKPRCLHEGWQTSGSVDSYYVEKEGFTEITEEQNYNMIDSRVNNLPAKPRKIGNRVSVLDRLYLKQAGITRRSGKPAQQMEVVQDMERRRK